MPRDKKKLEDSDSDSGPEDRGPAPKKPKQTSSSSKSSGSEEPSWELEKKRFVKVREFKGQVYIDIREYYEADGELKPGKKGISLPARQWQKLKDIMPEVDEALKNY